MTTHTDRIRQMAQKAGLLPCHEMYTEDLTRFAQLVAEDCARVAGRIANAPECNQDETRVASVLANSIRARYSLKD